MLHALSLQQLASLWRLAGAKRRLRKFDKLIA